MIEIQEIGRWCEKNNFGFEDKNLVYGCDFRKPIFRREVFLRFYEFHSKYKSHPGAVYIAFPWLSTHYTMSVEDKLWLAFINGCSQNIVTSTIIYKHFPSLKNLNMFKLEKWWNQNHMKFKAGSGWDADRKYFKIGNNGFPNCVATYQKIVSKWGSQENLFNELCKTNNPHTNFERTWKFARSNFITFGRLSTFSYLEFLRINGMNIDCNSLFLDDIDGSRSHRNGLCKVLGRDDLDWWKQDLKYQPKTIKWLKNEAESLFDEAKTRIPHQDLSLFTLESTLCCYKSWHRPNRRYPNVYMDMFHDRIKYAEKEWNEPLDDFWKMRRDSLPIHLRLENNKKDVGVAPEKQNHYLKTGQVIMMHKDWPCFYNDYNKSKTL